jgi:hypothetical protein
MELGGFQSEVGEIGLGQPRQYQNVFVGRIYYLVDYGHLQRRLQSPYTLRSLALCVFRAPKLLFLSVISSRNSSGPSILFFSIQDCHWSTSAEHGDCQSLEYVLYAPYAYRLRPPRHHPRYAPSLVPHRYLFVPSSYFPHPHLHTPNTHVHSPYMSSRAAFSHRTSSSVFDMSGTYLIEYPISKRNPAVRKLDAHS